MDPELLKTLAAQGAGVVCFAILIYALVRLAMYFGKPFIEAQRLQAQSMLEQAQSMKTQAECMGAMKDSVREFVDHDNNDHREILLGLRVVIKEVQQLSAEVKDQGKIIRGLCADAGKSAGALARKG